MSGGGGVRANSCQRILTKVRGASSPGYGALRGQVFGRTHRVEVPLGLGHCSTHTHTHTHRQTTVFVRSSGGGATNAGSAREAGLTGDLVDFLQRGLVAL